MDDREVLQAWAVSGARQAFGPSLHVEGDALFLEGWWHLALRVSPDVFVVRAEEPPVATSAVDQLTALLSERGLQMLGLDFPLIQPITYTALSLGDASWALWATDLDAGQRALAERAGGETFLPPLGQDVGVRTADFTAELGGARRLAGLPPSVVVAVGLQPEQVQALESALPECRVESRDLEAALQACSTLIPAVVVVDATERAGEVFVMEFRTEACGRFVPVVALREGGPPPGADVALDPSTPASEWVEPIRGLLP